MEAFTKEGFSLDVFREYWLVYGGNFLNMGGMAVSGILCLIFHNRRHKGKQIVTAGKIGVLAYAIPSITRYIFDGEWYVNAKYLPIPILIIACGTIWAKRWPGAEASGSTAEQHNVKRMSLIRETQLCIEEYKALASMRMEKVLALRTLLKNGGQPADEIIAYLDGSCDRKAFDLLLEELENDIGWKGISALDLLRICAQMAETLNAGKNIYPSRYRKAKNAQMMEMLARITSMERTDHDGQEEAWRDMEDRIRRYCNR